MTDGDRAREAWGRALRSAPLPSGAKLVALMLATYGGSDSPTIEHLAEDCGLIAKTVRKHRDTLVEAGWLRTVHASGGRGRANEYRLNIPAARAPQHRSHAVYALDLRTRCPKCGLFVRGDAIRGDDASEWTACPRCGRVDGVSVTTTRSA